MSHRLTVDFSKPIRLFPLAKCILLPHATLPLYIFEPRYRAMTRDALDSDGLIAMAVFDGDGYQLDYEGTPPIRPHVCVGYIAHHEQVMGGRYNILLQGIARAIIQEEIDLHQDGYRRAILRPTEQSVMEIDLEDQRHRLDELINNKYLQELTCIRNVRNWLGPELSTPAAIDLTWHATSSNHEQRYEILTKSSVFERAEQLNRHLEQTQRTLEIAAHMGPCQSETGLPMN